MALPVQVRALMEHWSIGGKIILDFGLRIEKLDAHKKLNLNYTFRIPHSQIRNRVTPVAYRKGERALMPPQGAAQSRVLYFWI